jgi:hypothetical protein
MPFEKFRKDRECYRLAPSTITDDRRSVPGSRTPLSITASLQPSNPTELLVLPEGLRDQESYTLFYETDDPLQTVKTSPNRMPDIVVHNGEEFTCRYTKKWRNDVINHYKSIIQKGKNKPSGGGGAPAP